MNAIQFVGTGVLVAFEIPLVLFAVLYSRSPWRQDPLGIALMGKTVAFALVVLIVIAGNFLPAEFDLPRYIIRIVAFVPVVVFLVLDVVNLYRIQTHSTKRLFFSRFIKHYPKR